MFYNLIERLGTHLNLSPDEALKSEFVKELCTDLIYGHVVVVDSKKNQVFTIKNVSEELERNPT
ncbi:MAG: hypothetical protein CBC04_08125 [Verrucomicrobia bacterium TMED44]|nr:MAG: hypothetical protein CBC04_08125 [Verrucomicrobia bacterium TMED44]